jgi:proline iminopeptidase
MLNVGVIVQGRYDVVCPVTTAWELSKRWNAELIIVKDSGHSAKEKSIRSELINWTNKFQKY